MQSTRLLTQFCPVNNDDNNRYAQPDLNDVGVEEGTTEDDRWRIVGATQYFKELSRVGPNRANTTALGLRNYLKCYFMSSVSNAQAPCQMQRALKGLLSVNLHI